MPEAGGTLCRCRIVGALGSAAMLVALSGCRSNVRSEAPAPHVRPAPAIKDFQPPDPDAARRTFEQILTLPDSQFDVAEAILTLGLESGAPQRQKKDSGAPAPVDIAGTLRELDRLAAKAQADLPEAPDAIDCFDALYNVVLDRRAADPFREDRAENYDLSSAVQRRRGSCLSLGIMTLAVARRMGLPIYGVQSPGHFFLKYASHPGDKSNGLNFDVTRPTPDNWKKLDDAFYRRWHKIDAKAESSGAYLRPLSDREVVSAFLASRSSFHCSRREFQQALADAERALALNTKNIPAYVNAGFAQEALGQMEKAAASYQQALQIDPHSARAMNNLAYLKVRDPQSSVYDIRGATKMVESALREHPDKAFLHATEAEIHAAKNAWRAAGRSMQQAMNLEPKNAAYRERFMYFRDKLRAGN
ncbi:MAG TPA: transglutaminase family protein [Planctomycetota bacterium]|nr:transglutaminase family protein [Planctomycetota bacterium]